MQICKNFITHPTTQRTAAISLAILAVATLVIGIVSKVGFLHGLSTQGSMGMIVAGSLVLSLEVLIVGIKKWKNSKTTHSQPKFVPSEKTIKLRISQWTLQSPDDFKKGCQLDKDVDAKDRQLSLLRKSFKHSFFDDHPQTFLSSSEVLLLLNTSHFTKTEWASVLPDGWKIVSFNETLIALNPLCFESTNSTRFVCGYIDKHDFCECSDSGEPRSASREWAATWCLVKPFDCSENLLFVSAYLNSNQNVEEKNQLVKGIKEIQSYYKVKKAFLGVNTAQKIPNLPFTNPNRNYYTLRLGEHQSISDTIFYTGSDLTTKHTPDDLYLCPGNVEGSINPSDHTPYILDVTFAI